MSERAIHLTLIWISANYLVSIFHTVKRLFTVHTESDFPDCARRQFRSLPLPPLSSPGSIGPECCAKLSRSSFVNAKIFFRFLSSFVAVFFPHLLLLLLLGVVTLLLPVTFSVCFCFICFPQLPTWVRCGLRFDSVSSLFSLLLLLPPYCVNFFFLPALRFVCQSAWGLSIKFLTPLLHLPRFLPTWL